MHLELDGLNSDQLQRRIASIKVKIAELEEVKKQYEIYQDILKTHGESGG